MWAILRADGFKSPFSRGKDVPTFTAMTFVLDKKAAESVANFAGIHIMAIAYKEAGRREGWVGQSANRRADQILLTFRFLGDFYNVNE